MLFGTLSFINEAKIWQRRFGGNVYSYLPYYTSAERSIHRYMNSFMSRKKRLCAIAQVMQQSFTELINEDNGIMYFFPKVPTCSMVHIRFVKGTNVSMIKKCHLLTVQKTGICLYNKLRQSPVEYDGHRYYYIEWNMGSYNSQISDEIYVKGWATFFSIYEELTNDIDNIDDETLNEDDEAVLEQRRNLIY